MSSKETTEKSRAAIALLQAKWDRQCIRPLPRYEIKRLDEYNWAIVKDGNIRKAHFYGKLISALLDFPKHLWSDEDVRSVQEAAATAKRIEEFIWSLRPMLQSFDLGCPPSMLGAPSKLPNETVRLSDPKL